HLLQHDRQERGLELLGGLLDLRALGGLRRAHGPDAGGAGRRRDQVRRRDGRAQVSHYCTSISACRAPAVWMLCRIEIMSRGVTPRALRPETRLARDAPDFRVTNCLPFSSSTDRSDCGTTAVVPSRENGAGWLTAELSWTVIVRLPCWMATVDRRTF